MIGKKSSYWLAAFFPIRRNISRVFDKKTN
jgi:hypothetical protein